MADNSPLERETSIFVARDAELARLDGYLAAAMYGRTQVCLVSGSVGTGKTALIEAFAARALALQQDLVVATGRADAYMGHGEPYLPFREALDLLTGDIEDKLAHRSVNAENRRRLKSLLGVSAQVLVENGPDLVGTFVPGTALWLKVGATALKKTNWFKALENLSDAPGQGERQVKSVDPGQIFEQYANVVAQLAERAPLVIALDDLHWADADSIALLFRLCRRLTTSRVLIIAAYRSDEVAVGPDDQRHPLDKATAELKRYFGDITIDLDQAVAATGQEFVSAYLASEPNRLDAGFHRQLYQHTGGHPLFTVESLRAMQERGDLVQDAGGFWVAGRKLDWDRTPERVEGALAERLQRVDKGLREGLELASVQGVQFVAEIIAGLQKGDARQLIRQLSSELQDRRRLVESVDTQRVGGQRVSRYQFAPKVIQAYIYGGLDQVELSYLHEDVGLALEALYGAQADEIAGQLARHFERAGLPDKAAHYFGAAGEQAAAIFATETAIDYFTQALALTPEKDVRARLELLLKRESLHDLRGHRPAQRDDLDQLAILAERLADPAAQAEVAVRRASLAFNTGDSAAAQAHAEQAAARLEAAGLDAREVTGRLLARAHIVWGWAQYQQGCLSDASQQQELALTQARGANDLESEASALTGLGNIAWGMGDHARATEHFEAALAANSRLGDRRRQWKVLNGLGLVAQSTGEFGRALAHYADALDIVQRIGDRRGETAVLSNQSQAYAETGQFEKARSIADRALELARDIGDQASEAILVANLADIAYYSGDMDLAKRRAEDAFAISHRIGDRVGQGCALVTRGDVLLAQGQASAAEEAFTQALDVWNEIDEPFGALGAHAGLTRVALRQGDEEARRKAGAHIGVIKQRLEENPGWGSGEVRLGLEILLTAYRAMVELGDPDADLVLQHAHQVLQSRAARLDDLELRRCYLDGFAAHRALQAAFTQRFGDS